MISRIVNLFSRRASTSGYAIGQIWEYKTREGESKSHVYIVRIDEHEEIGKIYHLFIDKLVIKSPFIEGGSQDALPHVPVDKKTLELSLTRMVGTSKHLPDISEGYAIWKEAFDSGSGGVFSISVSQIIDFIEQAMSQNE